MQKIFNIIKLFSFKDFVIKISQELKMLNELLRIILKKYQEEKNFKIFFLNIFYLF